MPKVVNGTSYNVDTPDKVVDWLETSRERKQRIRIFYGNSENGKCWMDEYDTIGHVGRSTGTDKIPLLIKTSRSSGGGALLEHCILQITVDCKVVYKHRLFHMPKMELVTSNDVNVKLPYSVYLEGKRHVSFDTEQKALHYIAFMKGERNSK